MVEKIPVAVLGATGLVGQRFAARLARHPWFELVELAASPKSEGQRYADACRWRAGGLEHAGLGERRLLACDPGMLRAPIVFSALDALVARELEPAFARAGAAVFSNASAYRLEPDVPLVVPEVNGAHLALLERQRAERGWEGSLVCNPNCTAAILATALAPLAEAFGVEALACTSMQAASGAGLDGVGALELEANVLPYIAGEEQKLARETALMLGRLTGAGRAACVEAHALALSAACHRVPVVDGHTLSVAVRLGGAPAPEAVREALASFAGLAGLPTAPERPIRVHAALDRPQPRLDAASEGGMVVHVGRVRACPVLGIRFTALGHNLERGAAGGSVLNAELCVSEKRLGGLDAAQRPARVT
jgi:aspartate-semialdehyde dehydrogenase